ncbi:MAG: hypothetical protein AAGL98_13925, partial [Planctomycetota bacterium]
MKMLVTIEGKSYRVEVQILDDPEHEPQPAPVPTATSPPTLLTPDLSDATGHVECPIPGNVQSVLVKPGDRVNANDTLLIIEATLDSI